MRFSAFLISLTLGAGGCAGGQTGEADGINCWDGEVAIDLGEETHTLGAEWAGRYSAKVYWTKKPFYLEHVDYTDAAETELTVSLTRVDAPARGYASCPGRAFVPMHLDIGTSDGRIREQRTVWFALRETEGTPPAPAIEGYDTRRSVTILSEMPDKHYQAKGSYYFGHVTLTEDQKIEGHILHGDEYGVLNTPCGGTHQLVLGERPDGARFADFPVPAEALAALNGHVFTLDFGNGHTSELAVAVRSTSTTACWTNEYPSPAMELAAEADLVDARGFRVASVPVRVVASGCREGENFALVDGCIELGIGGSGHVIAIDADDSLPDLGFDDGGAWVSQDAFGIVDYRKLTGGAGKLEDWYSGGYRATVTYEQQVMVSRGLRIFFYDGTETGRGLVGVSPGTPTARP